MTSIGKFAGLTAIVALANVTTTMAAPEQFCTNYAQSAVAQYNEGISIGAPGITPPVWSGDYQNHYNWCLRVDQSLAEGETQRRKRHLNAYRRNSEATMAEPSAGGAEMVTGSDIKAVENCNNARAITSDPSVAKAIYRMSYIDVAIVTAGRAEQKLAILPVPPPYAINTLQPQFRAIADGLVEQRSLAIQKRTQEAHAAKSNLVTLSRQVASYIRSKNAGVPIPIPQPFAELAEISADLESQVAATPINIPAPANAATPINLPGPVTEATPINLPVYCQ